VTEERSSAPPPPLGRGDHVRGAPGVPLVLLYGDFTCPSCALAHERLRVRPLRIAFRHFALRAKHPRAVALACAAEAAGRQGRFWELADLLFADQGHSDDPHLWAHAERLGLELERFEAERRSDAVAAIVQQQTRGGIRAGVAVTPTLFADGELLPGAPDAQLIDRLTG
jgi:protein-disulfide isomerase